MFKKSMLESKHTKAPVEGALIFNGYVDVRTSPRSIPRDLEQRLKAGEDVISIWFHHVHANHFKNLFKRSAIRMLPKQENTISILPSIDTMTTSEILEFCKSIDVHPAHLIPFDNDQELSLPTPLLELLIEMAYNGEASKGLNGNDVYLASAAIAHECKRIRLYLDDEKREAFDNNGQFSILSHIFMETLSDPNSMRCISKTTIVTPTKTFAGSPSYSYPYFDRVHDIAIIELEKLLEESIQSIQVREQVLGGLIGNFVKIYKKLIDPKTEGEMDANNFLQDVIRKLNPESPMEKRATDITAVAVAVQEVLMNNEAYHKRHKDAQDIYIGRFGMCGAESLALDESYLYELEADKFHELITRIKEILDEKERLIQSKKIHEEREGYYIRKVSEIDKAFGGIEDGYKWSLLNNRVLLSLHNINVKEMLPPQASPR